MAREGKLDWSEATRIEAYQGRRERGANIIAGSAAGDAPGRGLGRPRPDHAL